MSLLFVLCRLRTQEETAKQLESEKQKISDAAQDLQANLKVCLHMYTNQFNSRSNSDHCVLCAFLPLIRTHPASS